MKRMMNCAAYALAIACWMAPHTAWAQRGVGDTVGVAQRMVKPDVVALAGELTEITTGPCENTTGRSPLGTHLVIKTKNGDTLNVHLGPAVHVESLVADLSIGDQVDIEGFRTDAMKDGHYVARTVSYGDRTEQLRDEFLRPVWAGGRGRAASTAGAGARLGRGRGPGAAGYEYPRGRGFGGGYGRQHGRGAGWGW